MGEACGHPAQGLEEPCISSPLDLHAALKVTASGLFMAEKYNDQKACLLCARART